MSVLAFEISMLVSNFSEDELEPIPEEWLQPEAPTTRVFPCNEEECILKGIVFHSRSSLLEHRKAIHLGIKNYQCKYCDYSSAHKSNFIRHIKKLHGEHVGEEKEVRFD